MYHLGRKGDQVTSVLEPCAPFQMRGIHAFSPGMISPIHGPSGMLEVTTGVLRVTEEIPPVLKYIVGDLFLIESKRAGCREPCLNLGRLGEIVDQAMGHEHVVLGIGDMMKMNPFIALFNPWGDQEQNLQSTFLCRVDGWIRRLPNGGC